MKSVFQSEKECWYCHTHYNLNDHHILYGTANRKMSEKYGLKVWLCVEHHTGICGVHFVKAHDIELKQMAQEYYEKHYGSREDFIKDFGKSYL